MAEVLQLLLDELIHARQPAFTARRPLQQQQQQQQQQ
jgi:hypothetical protein